MRTTFSAAMLVLLGLVGWVQGQAPHRGVAGQAPHRGVPGQTLPRGVVQEEAGRPVGMAKPINGVITYTYYAGSTPTGPPLPGPPVDAGTYTVVATFKSADGNFTGASTATTFTIQKATPQLKVRHGGGTYNGAPFPVSGVALAHQEMNPDDPSRVVRVGAVDVSGVPMPAEVLREDYSTAPQPMVQSVIVDSDAEKSFLPRTAAEPVAGPAVGDNGLPFAGVAAAFLPRCWFNGEYLMWWIKDGPLPLPLVTTSSSPGTNVSGAIGQPSTTILYGGNDLDFGLFSGLRVSGGMWLDREGFFGLEGEFLFLQRQEEEFSAASNGDGNPPLYLPAFNSQLQAERALVVADPVSGLAGNVNIVSTSQLWGAQAAAVVNLANSESLWIDFLGGFRFLDLDESFTLSNVTTNLSAGFVDSLRDSFETNNQFYGGLMGMRIGYSSGPWFVSFTEKLALGATQQVVSINGAINESGSGAPTPGTFPGGFFTQPTNIGRRVDNRFSVVPEVQVKLGYRFTPLVTGFIAYNFIYWSSVARPGDQIDRHLNLSQSPIFGTTGGVLVGVAEPRPQANSTDFWTQGISFGLSLTY